MHSYNSVFLKIFVIKPCPEPFCNRFELQQKYLLRNTAYETLLYLSLFFSSFFVVGSYLFLTNFGYGKNTCSATLLMRHFYIWKFSFFPAFPPGRNLNLQDVVLNYRHVQSCLLTARWWTSCCLPGYQDQPGKLIFQNILASVWSRRIQQMLSKTSSSNF